MKIAAVRTFHFCAGHRVYMHESKCANLHGHNYLLTVHATAPGLDKLGRIIDFSVLKQRIAPWLQENWDHTTLVFEKDFELWNLGEQLPKSRPWYRCSFNPTAENMGLYLINEILPGLLQGTGVVIEKLELWETDNCKVSLSLK